MPALCRDCLTATEHASPACAQCGGRRIVAHPELLTLAIGHVDCDAFFASVEKRDRPELAGRPVIVGGGERGVVTAACYVARLYGVRSAMPMFKALRACPDAVVIKPDFAKYGAAARQIRALMVQLTPAMQPLSIDEAVLDLSGTDALHGRPPAAMLAKLAAEIERDAGITVSIGLAPNRLLAKLAAGRDKPRGSRCSAPTRVRGWRRRACACCPASVPRRSGGLRRAASHGSARCRRSARVRRSVCSAMTVRHSRLARVARIRAWSIRRGRRNR